MRQRYHGREQRPNNSELIEGNGQCTLDAFSLKRVYARDAGDLSMIETIFLRGSIPTFVNNVVDRSPSLLLVVTGWILVRRMGNLERNVLPATAKIKCGFCEPP